MTKELFLDPRLGQEFEKKQREYVMSNLTNWQNIKNYLGFDSEFKEAIEKGSTDRKNNIVKAQELAAEFGVDTQGLLGSVARKLGKTVAELTPRERAEALQQAVNPFIDPEKFKDHPFVTSELEKQFVEDPWHRERYKNKSTWEKVKHLARFALKAAPEYYFGSGAKPDPKLGFVFRKQVAIRQESMEELSRREVLKMSKREGERALAMEQHETALTPVQRFHRRQTTEQLEANWDAHRSRHRAWAND